MEIILQIDSYDGSENLFDKKKTFSITGLDDPSLSELIAYGVFLRKLAIETNHKWELAEVDGFCYLEVSCPDNELNIASKIEDAVITSFDLDVQPNFLTVTPKRSLPLTCINCGHGIQNLSPRRGRN